MTLDELNEKIERIQWDTNGLIQQLEIERDRMIHDLKHKFAMEHRKFNIGDYIRNYSLGIIKVESIEYGRNYLGEISIVYFGKRYHKVKCTLVPNKHRTHNIYSFLENNCKLVTLN